MNELPTRRPTDPPIAGPHVILHADGTRQTVFAGPNTWPRPRKSSPLQEAFHFVYAVAFSFSVVVGVITAGLLALEYAQLTVGSRVACGAITLLVCVWVTVRRVRRRRALKV